MFLHIFVNSIGNELMNNYWRKKTPYTFCRHIRQPLAFSSRLCVSFLPNEYKQILYGLKQEQEMV